MQVLEVYAVYAWDGTDRANFAFYLADKAEADAYAKQNPFDEVRPAILTIFDTVAEMEANSGKALRDRALAKLTVSERAALGV